MTDALLFVIMSLASYRLYRLLALDKLPPLERWREHVEQSIERTLGRGWAEGLTCPWCLGFWTSALVVGVMDVWLKLSYHPGLDVPLLQLLAVSCVVGLIGNADG